MLSILLIVCFSAFCQDCDKLLQDGLYAFTKMSNSGSFSKDLRTYYLSDSFKADMHDGKWGSSLTIPIEGVPVSLGMNYNENDYQAFRSKVLSISELNVSSNFIQTTFSTVPNTNLYDAYNKCVAIVASPGATGFIQGLNVETDNDVVFTIYYRPAAPGDPMPVISDFNVEPAGSVISGGLQKGQKLTAYSMYITCKRSPGKDLILTLQTDRGGISSKVSGVDNPMSGKEIPLGTVITSFLNLEQLNVATKNNVKSPGGVWTSQYSKWAPCDGRGIPNSQLQKITSQQNAPDLRGVFIRGLNAFDPYYTTAPKDQSQLNPNPTSLGEYQPDENKAHTHYTIVTEPHSEHGRFTNGGGGNQGGSENTSASGGSEARPKNVSMYYYIKIN